ncbi:MAG: phage minor capsid protein [Solirubrobacteraceae bacterium]
MAFQPDTYAYQPRLTEFDTIIRAAQRTIVSQVEAAVRSGDLSTVMGRRLQLAAVTATLDHLGASVTPMARRLVREAFDQGAARAAQQIVGLSVSAPEIPGAFAGVATHAVEAMQAAIEGRLTAAQRTIGREVADIYAREQRRSALRAILGAEGSPQAASKRMQLRLMQDKHIARAVKDAKTGFVDSAGKRWALDTYSNMATRTVTREAVVQGAIARMASHGIALARVSKHASSCEICLPYEGTLISLDGSMTEWKGQAVSDTEDIPPFHPNCAHSLEPVSTTMESLREELESETVG